MSITRFLRSQSRRIAVLLIASALFWLTIPPSLSAAEQDRLAARFSFSRSALVVPIHASSSGRLVQPSLQPIASWISSVGAAVALADINGTGLPNDVCLVDVNTNQVVVSPAPGSPKRYQPFVLSPRPLPYDDTMAPMGCLPGDVNEDGLTDIVVYYWGRSPIVFLHKSVAPDAPLSADSFTPQELVSPYERWFSNSACFADLDGNGHLDLVVGNYFPDGSHILDVRHLGTETMTSSLARGFNGGGVHFLMWARANSGANPSVTYRDVHGVLPGFAAHGWTLAVGASDLNNDGLPEIYLANDFGPDRLLVNRSSPGRLAFTVAEGTKGFTTPNSKVLGHDSFKGMGVTFGDLNQRGLTDIVVSNITSPYALEESNFVFMNTGDQTALSRGIAPFVDQSTTMGLAQSGWSWDVKLGDFDNRGQLEVLQAVGFLRGSINRWPELQELAMANQFFLENPGVWPQFQPGDDLSGHETNTFYVRAGDGRYYDFGSKLGFDQGAASRSIAVADVFGDGRLDVAVANQWGTSSFYGNTSPDPGQYLELHLLLPVAGVGNDTTKVVDGYPTASLRGRPAIGARVVVHFPDGHKVTAEVDGGNGHGGKNSPEIHIGLGKLASTTPMEVDIVWRDAAGSLRRESHLVTPGQHTLVLASQIGSTGTVS